MDETQEQADERLLEQAHQIIRRQYFRHIGSIAEDLLESIRDGEIRDREKLYDYIHERADGSYYCIHTHANFEALFASENYDAIFDEGIEPSPENLFGSITFYAVRADICKHHLLEPFINADEDFEIIGYEHSNGLDLKCRDCFGDWKLMPEATRQEFTPLLNVENEGAVCTECGAEYFKGWCGTEGEEDESEEDETPV